MPRPNANRRQRRGSAWYWQQTNCWYFTPRGSKTRQALFDEKGRRIRGAENKRAAQLALARVRLQHGLQMAADLAASAATADREWLVARVCAEYLRHCDRVKAAGRMHPDYHSHIVNYLNELCRYCGALPVAELKRGDVQEWVDRQPAWRSLATRRNVIAIVLAAFYFAEHEHKVRNPLRGLKKPPPQPRLHSLSPEEEQEIYGATDQAFGQFLFAAIHTGLRPFCELAKLTAEAIEATPRGMMWRVYSSKTKKTRKIPVRPEVAKLTKRLLKQAPRGSGKPIFQNPQGKEWKKATGVGRFLAIKRELRWDREETRRRYSTYSCRHTFAHRMLSGFWNRGIGCSIEILAELMGDTPKVVFDHYGREWGQHYQEPLWAAIGE